MIVELFFAGVSNRTTSLLSAVNRNQLAFFLAANLLTGLVNMSMQTLFASSLVSFAVMTAYLSTLALLAIILDKFNVTLKFW
jgi:phosphatidylinositol glycan class W